MTHTRCTNLVRMALKTALALSIANAAAASTVLETESQWDGASEVLPWGSVTSVYGQTIVAPAGAGTLTGFSLRLKDTASQIPFSTHVYAWTGTQIIGPALFSQTGQNFGGGDTGTFLQVQFAPNAVVTPGSSYVMFLSTIGQSPALFTSWGLTLVDAYVPGVFVFQNTDSFDTLSTGAWDDFAARGGNDLAFTATFGSATVVPVSGGLGLMLSGALVLGLAASRRRRN